MHHRSLATRPVPTRPRRALALAAGLLAAAPLAVPASPALAGGRGKQPGLEQRIAEDQEVALDEAVLGMGHVDMGPRYRDGRWTLMVHDDSRLTRSVWRELDRTVLHVPDTAQRQVPDDPAYAFLGAEPGARVHVVPQTQQQDVVWVGWNTQDPEVIETVDRGVTLSLTDVEGPGEVVVYLQDGGFGEPDVLWDSRVAAEQPLWVDVNTHTHANWVFTEPGVYLVTVEATADLVDGTSVAATGTVRYAVGDDASTRQALGAVPAAATTTRDGGPPDPASTPEVAARDSGRPALLPYAAGGAAALALVLAVVVVLLRGRSARRAALEEE